MADAGATTLIQNSGYYQPPASTSSAATPAPKAATPAPPAPSAAPGPASPEASINQNDAKIREISDEMKQEQDDKAEAPPKPPTLPPAPQFHEISALQAFGSVGSVIAVLGSLMVRRPLIAALNGAAGAMRAVQEGNSESYDRQYKIWKDNTDQALKIFDAQNAAYDNVIKNKQLTFSEMTARLGVLAAANQDQVMIHTMRHEDASLAEQVHHDRVTAGLEAQRISLEAANMQDERQERHQELALRVQEFQEKQDEVNYNPQHAYMKSVFEDYKSKNGGKDPPPDFIADAVRHLQNSTMKLTPQLQAGLRNAQIGADALAQAQTLLDNSKQSLTGAGGWFNRNVREGNIGQAIPGLGTKNMDASQLEQQIALARSSLMQTLVQGGGRSSTVAKQTVDALLPPLSLTSLGSSPDQYKIAIQNANNVFAQISSGLRPDQIDWSGHADLTQLPSPLEPYGGQGTGESAPAVPTFSSSTVAHAPSASEPNTSAPAPAAAATPSVSIVPRTPSKEAIAALRQSPNTAAEFDAWYGPGSAARILGGQ